MKHLFGPVNSRRLGMSLGIDLVPYKTCTFNCVYCECGATTHLTTEIKEYVSTEEVITELDEYLKNNPLLDVITCAGSGEPTLHSGIGTIINFIKKSYPHYKTVVLTNGSLLWMDQVKKALANVDILIPSLDAVSIETFKKILRPASGISPEKIINGLIEFSKTFTGSLILEVFIIPGLNDNIEELALFKNILSKIKLDKIQLNSLDRPGTENWLQQADRQQLIKIKEFLHPLPVEIIGNPPNTQKFSKSYDDIVRSIISILKRRPSTIDDLVKTLSIDKTELEKTLTLLHDQGVISQEEGARGIFYKMA